MKPAFMPSIYGFQPGPILTNPELIQQYLNKYFKEGDWILDPFCDTGNILVGANTLGINAVGVDHSWLSCMISRAKLNEFDLNKYKHKGEIYKNTILKYEAKHGIKKVERHLRRYLLRFTRRYNKHRIYKYKKTFAKLVKRYNLILYKPEGEDTYFDKWLFYHHKKLLLPMIEEVKRMRAGTLQDVLYVTLIKIVESCKAVPHGKLSQDFVQLEPYYCPEHRKVCKPKVSLFPPVMYKFQAVVDMFNYFHKSKTKAKYYISHSDIQTCRVYQILDRAGAPDRQVKGIVTRIPYIDEFSSRHRELWDVFDLYDSKPLAKYLSLDSTEVANKLLYVDQIRRALDNAFKVLEPGGVIILFVVDTKGLCPILFDQAGLRVVEKKELTPSRCVYVAKKS